MKIGAKKIYLFTEQLNNLISNGIRVSDALDIISKNEKNKKLKKIIKNIHSNVLKGKTLYESFAKHRDVFDDKYLALIKIGEISDDLQDKIKIAALILKNKLEYRQKTISILIYPAIILCFTLLLIFFLINFVLPNFLEIFSENSVLLPTPTLILLYIHRNFLKIILSLVIVTFLVYATFVYINKNKKLKYKKDKIILSLPFINSYIKNGTSIFIFENLHTMLDSGINIVEVADILLADIKNSYIKSKFKIAIEDMKRGNNVADSLIKMGLVPKNYEMLLKVGEETGNLSTSLKNISEIIKNDLENLRKISFIVVEPLVILILGCVVGFVLISIYLPILNMTNII